MARPGTFPKGTSGNPHGRPKRGSALTDFLRFKLAQPASDDDRRTRAEAWAEAFIQQATEGDAVASKAILDRVDGPVAQPITGADGGPITFVEIARQIAQREDGG